MYNKIFYYINRSLSMSLSALFRKVFFLLFRKIRHQYSKLSDSINSTFSDHSPRVDCICQQYSQPVEMQGGRHWRVVAEMYLAHKFDLLGSGWVVNSYNAESSGVADYNYKNNVDYSPVSLINRANNRESHRISSLIDKEYKPIDWQKDIKSGYRWSEKKWYLEQRVSLPGADIKVPWELGRLQHLPQLAIFALSHKEYQNRIIKEFRNQILDFLSMNPPRFGVQWTCTMDVGIRVANMLLAYNLLLQIDTEDILDKSFRDLFSRSIYEHGLHIVNNLEYNEYLTSNHYLSNIGGLVFVTSHLESEPRVDQWLAFAVQEIISEMRKQFYEDGSNFEGSTNYHRLSAEIMVYSTALILGLRKEKITALKNYSSQNWRYRPRLKSQKEQEYKIAGNRVIFPDWFVERLFNAGRFTMDITKPTGEIPQIGDNDSGRFFKLTPMGELITSADAVKKYKNLENYPTGDELFWDENILDHRTLLSAMSGLFENDFGQSDVILEMKVIEYLAIGRKLKAKNIYNEVQIDPAQVRGLDNLKFKSIKKFSFSDSETSINQGLELTVYLGIGLYIFKSSRLYLVISAGPNGQNGNGGHAHNDKLSFELNVDGEDIIVDPGTYLYTPFPDERNKFRGTVVHNTIYIEGEEQNEWLPGRNGLFFMKNQAKCYLLEYGDDFIDLAVEYRGIKNRRKFIINEDKLVIESYSNREFTEKYNRFNLYSNGYGKLIQR